MESEGCRSPPGVWPGLTHIIWWGLWFEVITSMLGVRSTKWVFKGKAVSLTFIWLLCRLRGTSSGATGLLCICCGNTSDRSHPVLRSIQEQFYHNNAILILKIVGEMHCLKIYISLLVSINWHVWNKRPHSHVLLNGFALNLKKNILVPIFQTCAEFKREIHQKSATDGSLYCFVFCVIVWMRYYWSRRG